MRYFCTCNLLSFSSKDISEIKWTFFFFNSSFVVHIVIISVVILNLSSVLTELRQVPTCWAFEFPAYHPPLFYWILISTVSYLPWPTFPIIRVMAPQMSLWLIPSQQEITISLAQRHTKKNWNAYKSSHDCWLWIIVIIKHLPFSIMVIQFHLNGRFLEESEDENVENQYNL